MYVLILDAPTQETFGTSCMNLCLSQAVWDFDETHFIKADGSEYYPDAVEPIPPKCLNLVEKLLQLHVLLLPIMLDAMLLNDHKLVF